MLRVSLPMWILVDLGLGDLFRSLGECDRDRDPLVREYLLGVSPSDPDEDEEEEERERDRE